jgi:hypothetical protein
MFGLTDKLFGMIAAGVAALLLVGFVVQTVRIDGFPLFYTGMRTQLAECNDAQRLVNEAVLAAADKAREEGRATAIADRERLAADDAKRLAESNKTVADLQAIVARLRQPQPPVRVIVDGQPPVVITPPVAMSCDLDRGALDDLRTTLNRGRL